MESRYTLVDAVPPAEDFCRLRIISGLTPALLRPQNKPSQEAVMAYILNILILLSTWGGLSEMERSTSKS